MKTIKDKLIESRIVMEHRLTKVSEDYYSAKPLLDKYESLYGNTDFSKKYITQHGEKWAKQVQEG